MGEESRIFDPSTLERGGTAKKTNRAESASGIFAPMGVVETICMHHAFACVFPVPHAQRV